MAASGKVLAVLLTTAILGFSACPGTGLSAAQDSGTRRSRRDSLLKNPFFSTIPDQYRKTDVASLIRIRTPADLLRIRKALTELAFGTARIPAGPLPELVEAGLHDPDWADTPSLASIDSLRYTMEHGIDSFMYFFHARRPSGRLALYHEGHTVGFEYRPEIIRALLEIGCDVIALSMPLSGRNSRPLVKIDRIGYVLLDKHVWLQYFDRPMRFFMEPIASAVNYGQRQDRYGEIVMVGFSGGGWATTVYSAMDPRIGSSFPVAGTIPMFLRSSVEGKEERNIGDFEQTYPGLLRIANYLEMYVLGSSGKKRRQLQVINQFDTTITTNGIRHRTYLPSVQEAVKRLGPGGFDVFLDNSGIGNHEMSGDTILRIASEIEGAGPD